MEYETEEQQVEALKAWWAENGKSVVAGVVLGVVVIGGWSFWQSRGERMAIEASDSFSEAMLAVESGDADTVNTLADKLADDHSDTLYAAYGNLAAARVAIEANDLDAAAERLAWVIDKAPQDEVQTIARVRLARVEGARGGAEAGLKSLPSDYPEAFIGLVEEARGDLLVMSGDADGAREAYEKAQGSDTIADPNALTMKLNELAVAESAS